MRERRDIEGLYLRYGASVFRRAHQLLGSLHDAEDAVHDVFAKAIDAQDQFRGDSAVMTWLYSATTNLCLNRLRDGRRREVLAEQHYVPMQAHAVGASAERLSMLRQLIARMPDELAEACVYHYVDEMTHEEIAEVLGCSRRHVGDLLARARAWAAKEHAQ